MRTTMRYGQLIFEGTYVLAVLLLWCVFYSIVEPPTRYEPTAISMRGDLR